MRNSIQTKIVMNSVVLVCLALIFLGTASIAAIYVSAMASVETNMENLVSVTSSRVEWELKAYSNIAGDLGANNRISDPSVSDADKQAILDNWTLRYGLERCNVVDADGNGIDGNNYSDREYFKAAMQGKSYISEPLISKVTGNLTIIIAAPMYVDREPAGCVYVVPNEEFLNNIMRDIVISDNSYSYMVDQSGRIIAHPDTDTVKASISGSGSDENSEDIAEASAADSSLMDIYAMMISGETGYDHYKSAGRTMDIAYHPVDGTNGWSLAIIAPQSDFMGGTYTAIAVVAIIAVVILTASVLISMALGRSIGRPIKLCTERIDHMSRGDLSSPVPEVRTGDETGILADATAATVHKLNSIINDIGRILGEMAEGNFNVNTKECSGFYAGDFRKIIDHMDDIKEKLTKTLSEIDVASEQVLTGSEQVSIAAQNLSQGTTEQASSVEHLAATLREISEEVSETSVNCIKAKERVSESASFVNEAIEEMKHLSTAMNHISSTSDQIGNIIKTIEDIAFQTNILALNAAVEAARAGEAGKGFAVVAEEVRNLASKSAVAASDTTELIEQSIEAVNEGMSKAAATSTALQNVGTKAAAAEEIVGTIADASRAQSESLDHVDINIDQISSVVQRNAATSEESAASAEELSSQATMLKDLIKTFKLSGEGYV
ncbi:MAG: methyl-accepting chemotaxis protein [Bacteroides sp.]|nr:methyl-accepting chemotaxis protein [Bacteroides sp.]